MQIRDDRHTDLPQPPRAEPLAGRIRLAPFDEALIQPASIDVRCDRRFRVFRNSRYGHIDVKQEQAELTELIEIDDGGPFILHPGEFVLGATLAALALRARITAR